MRAYAHQSNPESDLATFERIALRHLALVEATGSPEELEAELRAVTDLRAYGWPS